MILPHRTAYYNFGARVLKVLPGPSFDDILIMHRFTYISWGFNYTDFN